MKRCMIAAVVLSAGLGLAGNVGAGGKTGPLPVSKTPEEAYRAAKEASSKGDWKLFMKHLAPETVDSLATTMLMMGALSKGIIADNGPGGQMLANQLAGAKDEISKVLLKHGYTDDLLKKLASDPNFPSPSKTPTAEQLAKVAARIRDCAGFGADMMAVVMPAMAKLTPGKSSDPFADKVLKDVKVDGDKASGKVATFVNGMEQPFTQPIEFRRINGNWLVVMPMGGSKAKAPGPQ